MTKTELLKIAKPILFNTEMVKAILEGRKTVTRRVVKDPLKYQNIPSVITWIFNTLGEIVVYTKEQASPIIIPPPHQIGDIFYVRETWYYENHMHDLTAGEPDLPNGEYSHRYVYRASSPDYPVDKWKPSLFMPKVSARTFLKVTDIRVERLQDITVEQAIKEGFEGIPCGCSMTGCTDCYDFGWSEPPQVGFMYTWDSTIKKQDLDKYGWEANPWVWVYEFERIEI